MTEEEMIQDYIRELEEHDFQVNEHVLGNSSVRKRTFLITEGEYQMQVLRIDFDIDPGYDNPVFIDRLGQTGINNLMEYCWLFMRTAIFLKDLERFEHVEED